VSRPVRSVSLSRDGRKWKLIDYVEGEQIVYVDSIVARDGVDAVDQAARIAGLKPAALKQIRPDIYEAKPAPARKESKDA
jgi:hypothetical protein